MENSMVRVYPTDVPLKSPEKSLGNYSTDLVRVGNHIRVGGIPRLIAKVILEPDSEVTVVFQDEIEPDIILTADEQSPALSVE